MHFMEFDDVSIKPIISRSILSPTLRVETTKQNPILESPNHQLFNYRKNTILTEEDMDG